jgi:hypothetical protein
LARRLVVFASEHDFALVLERFVEAVPQRRTPDMTRYAPPARAPLDRLLHDLFPPGLVRFGLPAHART